MDKIYDLSWNKDSFIEKLSLFFKSNWKERKRIKSHDNRVRAQGYSALSSTYYSIVGTAYAQFKKIFKSRRFLLIKLPLFCFTWGILAYWCNIRMLFLSNKVFKLSGGYKNMTTGMCDIRQSILRKRGRYLEAGECIKVGLLKSKVETHTLCLLNIGLAEIYKHYGNQMKTQRYVNDALEIAEQVEETNLQQVVRIYKHCANLVDWLEMGNPLPGRKLREKAEELAVKINAKDQILKIGN